jgi:DNA-binding CsgD family transcriptional regulator
MDEAIARAGEDVDASLLIDLAEIDQWQGRPWAAIARLEKVAESPAAERADIRAQIQLRLLYLKRWAGDIEGAIASGQAAVTAAQEADNTPVLVAVQAAFAEAEASSGDVKVATDVYEQAVATARELPDGEFEGSLEAFYSLGWAAIHLDRYIEALDHFERGLVIARRMGNVRFLLTGRSDPVEALIRAGRAREAILRGDEAVEAARLHPSPRYLWWSLWMASAALLRAGDTLRARVAFDEAVAVGDRMPPQPMRDIWMGYQSAALPAEGEHAAAVQALYGGCGGEELLFVPIGDRQSAWEILTRAALAEPDLDRAEAIVAEAEGHAGGFGLRSLEASAYFCRALLEEAKGKLDRAEEAANAAATAAEDAGALIWAERSRTLLGRVLVAANRRTEAAAILAQAEESLSRLGAENLRAEAAREMRKLGRRTRRRGPDATAGATVAAGAGGELEALSGREREVAELVAQQLTNREIAERLVLSEKTVESHLRNVFAKLSVSSRVAVAQAIERGRIRD